MCAAAASACWVPRPSLLDREVRAIAGRVDVLDAADASVLIDRDEAAIVLGQASDRRTVHRRQRNHLVRVHSPVSRGQDQLTALALVGEDSGLDIDPAGVEQRADGLARGRSEDGERGLLGCDDGDPDVVEPELESPPLRHQRELVDRQRPGDPGRHDERDPPRPLTSSKQRVDP